MENMKNTMNMTYLTRAFQVLAIMGALTGCVMDYGDCPEDMGGDGRLSVAATVSDGTLVTRAESVVDLKEKDIQTLDVFVEHITNGTGDGTFMKQYHLTAEEGELIPEKVNNWLANNWRAEGLKIGQNYNIYVATNNTQTVGTIANVAALKALVADEVTDGVAIINEDNDNVTWGETTTSGNIYKLYDANPGSYRALTSDKKFMMDGVLENWTPTANSRDQVFKPVTLSRAAAKIVLNVNFGADFLKSLTHDKKIVDDTETWVEKPAEEQLSITGSPAWKFYNFAFGAPVFDPKAFDEDADITPVEVHNSDFNIFHNQSYTGDNKQFTITTYTYPNQWAQANYATDAPSLVISVGFTQGTGDAAVTNYHYYRIPLVKSTVTSIERNHIYVINATISTAGSAIQEDADLTEDIQYAVLPWNDKNNSDVIENTVESVQHLYLKVNPKIITLRGDDYQDVIITYLKATGTEVGWQLFTFNTTTEVKGNAVDPTNANAVWGWFYDKYGKMKTTFSNWNHMGVTIEQSTEGSHGSKGTVTVTSRALDNRAIKYMLLRIYLKDNPALYEDVIIRHFPTDNIQSITGQWSSYHTGGSSIEYSDDPEADGWEPGSYQTGEREVAATDSYDRMEVLNDGTPSNHDAGDYRVNYSSGQNNSTVQTQYRNNISQGVNRYNTNGEANAALGADGYWYWGDTSYYIGNNGNDYDWRTNRYGTVQNNGTYRYRWTNYYRSQYKKTHYYKTVYYRETVVTNPETGNWVDWDRDAGQRGTTKWVVRSDDPLYTDTRFHAHVWNEADNHVHNISSSTTNMAYDSGTQTGSGHTNNHMYVVQISATSDKYVLGKPILGNPSENQSMDQVVSPSFMIASQLGVVSTGWSAASAAEHCRRYMEVGTDGTRYIGWRLPTNEEIEIISEYQMGRFGNITIAEADRVMDAVLKGSDYFNLSGGTTPSNYTGTGGSNGNFLRCIRDLSAEEIEKLNGFDILIEKYQAR